MKKKLLLPLVTLLLLAGCGGSSSNDSVESLPTDTTTTTSEDPITTEDPTTTVEETSEDPTTTIDETSEDPTTTVDSTTTEDPTTSEDVTTSEDPTTDPTTSEDPTTSTEEETSTSTEPPVPTYSILNGTSNSRARVLSLATSAEENEVVSFQVYALPGYLINEVVVYSGILELGEVRYPVEYNETTEFYSFTMPALTVTVEALTVASVHRVTKNDPNSLINTIKGDGEILRDGYAYANSSIKIDLRDNDYKRTVGLRIEEDDKLITADRSTSTPSVSFTMPSHNITITPVTEDYLRDITVVNATTHLTLKLYTKVEGEYVEILTSSAVADQVVYAEITSDHEDFGLNTILGEYKTSSSTTYYTKASLTKESDGKYSFTMPKSVEFNLTITEENMSLFRGEEFVGDYVGFNLYKGSAPGYDTKPGTNNQSYGITSSGRMIQDTLGSRTDASINVIAHDAEQKELTVQKGSSNYSAYYGDDILYGGYNFGKNSPTDDATVGVKPLEATDTYANYVFKFEILRGASSTKDYQVAQAYRVVDGVETLYKSMFIDIKKAMGGTGVYLDNVEFRILNEATSIFDTLVKYDVYSNNEYVCTVDSLGAGGPANRAVLDSVGGTFTDSAATDSELVLNGGSLSGSAIATFRDSTWSYTIDGTDQDGIVNLTIRSGANSVVFKLDLTTMTYTIVDEQGALNDYHGRTFSGTTTDNSYNDPDTYTTTIVFTTDTIANITVKLGSTTMIPNTSEDGVGTYVIDEETGVVTITLSNGVGILVLTPNEDKTQLTSSADSKITNYYITKGAVFSEVL